MRLSANENIPRECVEALRGAGHDVTWIRDAMPGASDARVLAAARDERRLLITFDKDFGEMVFRAGRSAADGIVLFRIPQPSAPAIAKRIVAVLESREDWFGHFSVVDERAIRMRPLR